MTQIIGAICDNGKTALAISDRMITTGDLSLAFEHELPKMDELTPNCIALTAGSALIHAPIFENVCTKLGDKSRPKISEVVDELVKEFQELRIKNMENEVFREVALTIKQFYENQQQFHDAVVMRLTEKMEKYSIDLHILVVGVDSEGSHIYHIRDPGTSMPFDALGFCCIGIGQRHADVTFAYRRYTPSLPLKKALFIAYEAKKRAEMAGGVGKSTDITILDGKKFVCVPQNIVAELEKTYNLMESERAIYGKEINEAIEGIHLE
jgi:hypothetical protein